MSDGLSQPVIAEDYRSSVPCWPPVVRPPAGAPNVVVVVLDDVGYAQLGCFGSDLNTPAMDALAAGGLRYASFHATALCSPTRACVLTGRNHHSNHMGTATDLSSGYPGYDARIPPENGTASEILRDHGYATFALGKWHLTPAEESGMGAPRDRWPLGKGFERFYGFLGADTDQFSPALVHDNHQTPPPKTPDEGYHLSEDLADRAIEFVNDLGNSVPDKPFFMWLAFGACHAPHQAPREFIERNRGKFDKGWDVWRDDVYRRQQEMGIIPPATSLSPRPPWIPAWSELDDVDRSQVARMMEVYAAFLEHTDFQIGRVVDHLRETGQLDNTVFLVMSDNGASPEGGRNGAYNICNYLNVIPEDREQIRLRLDSLGTRNSYGHYPFGWAWAGNAPLKRWKQEAHEGGIACPFIVHWPRSIGTAGEIRRQYVHAIDVLPTILEAAGIQPPDRIRGIRQTPMHGVSFLQTFHDPSSPEVRHTQYYEVRGCRAIYHEGWKAVAYHPRTGVAWDGSDPARRFADDTWELYHVASDFSECRDMAQTEPQLLDRLVSMWWVQAGRYNVLPLDNRGSEKHGDVKRQLAMPRTTHILRTSPAGIPQHAAVNLRNRSHQFLARIEVPQEGAEGVILAQGSGFGGFSFFVQHRRLRYVYNYLARTTFEIVADAELREGCFEVSFEYVRTRENGGLGTLMIDGEAVGSGEIANTLPVIYGLPGYVRVGNDFGYPISPGYRTPFPFSGRIRDVTVRVLECAENEIEAWRRVEDLTQ